MVVQSVTDAPLCTTRCRLLLFRLHVRHALTFIDGDASYIALSLLLLIYMPWRHTLQPVIESKYGYTNSGCKRQRQREEPATEVYEHEAEEFDCGDFPSLSAYPVHICIYRYTRSLSWLK